jgi:hypothetical protein
MQCDNISPPGAWREEILKGPATTSQLRVIIAELEQSIRSLKAECLLLKEHNFHLVKELAELVAKDIENQTHLSRLRKGQRIYD